MSARVLLLIFLGIFCLTTPSLVLADNHSESRFCSWFGWAVRPVGMCDKPAPVPPVVVSEKAPEEAKIETVQAPVPPTVISYSTTTQPITQEITNEYITVQGGGVSEAALSARIADVLLYIDSLPHQAAGSGIPAPVINQTVNRTAGVDREYVLKSIDKVYETLGEDVKSLTVDSEFTNALLTNAHLAGISYADGPFGVGTSSPSDMLAVAGAVFLADSAPTATANRLYSVGGALYWAGAPVGGGGSLFTDGGASTYLTSLTDNLGIGTSTPTQKLSVAGGVRITGAIYDNSNSAGTNGYVLQTTGSGFAWVATSSLGVGGGSPFGADINVTELASEDFGDFTCNGATCVLDTTYLSTTTGNWTGTFDGQEGSYYLDADNLTNLSVADTGLGVSAVGLGLSGDDIVGIVGYEIPLQASSTNWNTFYDTPSSRITAGTNISWAGNTLNVSGLGNGTFLGLSDTPGSFTANRIPYMNASAITTDADFTFDGVKLSAPVLSTNNSTTTVITIGSTPFLVASTTRNAYSLGTVAPVLEGTTISDVLFIGYHAGLNTTNTSASTFIGYRAGADATVASNSIFLGNYSGDGATSASFSNFFGDSAGYSATNADNSNFFGYSAGTNAINADNSNFFGGSAGFSTNADNANFLGLVAGGGATNASYSNFLGHWTGYQATNAPNSNFFGQRTGYQATNASSSNFFGQRAGYQATNAAHSIFIGHYAGYADAVNNTTGGTSIAIGQYAGTGGFSNSIALGRGVVNSAAQQLNIGNVLYATGLYNSDTQSSSPTSGNIGIGTSSPASKLDVWGDFRVGTSSTPTLFTDVSTGQVIVGADQTTSEAFLVVQGDTWSSDQNLFEVKKDSTSVFSVDEDGDISTVGTEFKFTNNSRLTFRGVRSGSGPENDYMQFRTGNVTEIHFQNGYIGVGTTSPDTRLHIGSSTPNALTSGELYKSAFIAGSLEVDGTLYDNANSAGTNGMVLQTTGSGFNWVATSTLGFTDTDTTLTVGTDNQIPFSNAGGTDFDYSSNFTFDGTLLTVAGTVDAETFNATTDTVLTYNGAVFALASSTLESVTLGDGAGGSAAALETRMTAIGDLAGGSSSGANFTGVGYRAGNFNTDNYFTGVGTFAGQSNTGDSFVGVGGLVGTDNTGNNFSGLGRQTGRYNTGNDFTGIGYGAGVNNTGDYFTGLGSATGGKNTGDNNTFVGYAAGFDATYYLSGSSNTFLGANSTYDTSGLATSTITNATAVGANVTLTDSNSLVLGNGANVGIGTTSPTRKLSVVSTGTSWPDAAIQVSNTVANRYAQIEYAGDTRTWSTGVGNSLSSLTYDVRGKYYIYDQTGNVFPFVIDTNGKVGIGTPNPTRLLTLVASGSDTPLQVSSNNNTRYAKIEYAGDTRTWQAGVGNSLSDIAYDVREKYFVYDVDADLIRFVINTAGNIGIGTSSPASKLDVWGDFRVGTSGTPVLYADTSTERVGVGTVSPATTLHLMNENAASNGPVLRLSGRPANGGQYHGYIQFWNDDINQEMASIVARRSGNGESGADLEFWTQADPSQDLLQRMVIDDDGLVGIGTSSPTELLSIAGGDMVISDSNAVLTLDSTAGQARDLVLTADGTDATIMHGGGNLNLGSNNEDIIYISPSSDNSVLFNARVAVGTTTMATADIPAALFVQTFSTLDILNLFETGGTEVFTVLESGNVGIGTTSPAKKLSVEATSANVVEFNLLSASSNTILTLNSSDGAIGNGSFFLKAADGGTDVFGVRGTGSVEAHQGATNFNSYGFINDTDTGIFSPAGNTIGFSSGNAERMRMNNSGFSIGTTTIGSRLSVQSTGTTDILNLFETGGTEVFTVLESGNVGIGTTNPGGKLEIEYAGTTGLLIDSSNTANNVSAIRFNRTGTNVENGLSLDTAGARKWFFGQDNDSTEDLLLYGQTNTRWIMNVYDGSGDVAFGSVDTASPSLYIEYDGNVGIGTSTPASTLDVWGDFRVGTSGTPTFIVDTANNRVGFGTANPANDLHIHNEDGDAVIRITNSDSGSTDNDGIAIGYNREGGSDEYGFVWLRENEELRFATNNTERMRLDNNGNLGIGTTSPQEKLHVQIAAASGNILRLQDSDSTCNFDASGSGPSCGSDRTLKKNISEIEGELETILALEPSFWNWKTDKTGAALKSGFIAQDVELVLPELVTEGTWIDGSQKKFLNIGGMMPYVVGSIKELWAVVTGNRDKIETLEDRIEALESALEVEPPTNVTSSGGSASSGGGDTANENTGVDNQEQESSENGNASSTNLTVTPTEDTASSTDSVGEEDIETVDPVIEEDQAETAEEVTEEVQIEEPQEEPPEEEVNQTEESSGSLDTAVEENQAG